MSITRFVRIRGHVSGPFPEDKLAALVKRGQLTRSHELSEDGQTWIPAGELESLFSKPRKGDSTSPSKAPAEAADSSRPTEVVEPAVTPDTEKWFYAINGRKSGPVGWADLRDGVTKGKVPLDALVWTEGMADWREAASVPGLLTPSDAASHSRSASMSWGELLPVFQLWNDGSWTFPWVQFLAIALLFPLLALEYQGHEHIPVVWVAITFLCYFSLLWTAFFYWCVAPSPIGAWRLIGVWLFTATLGILGTAIASAFAEAFFIDAMSDASSASLFKRVVGWTVAVGLVEEFGKMVAVLLMTRHMVANKLPRTCAFVGIVSGLSFGTVEAAFYTAVYVVAHQQSTDTPADAYGMLFFLLMLRWICLPLLHAVWAGISGFFVGLSYGTNRQQWQWILRGVLIAALLHGVYDVGAADATYSWLTVVSAAVSLSLLVGYLRSEDRLSALVVRQQFSTPTT